MEKNTELRHQVEGLYHAPAKQLYNLALYAIGDGRLAEQLTLKVFFIAFNRFSDKFDTCRFKKHCFKLLYRQGKKVRWKTDDYIGHTTADCLSEILIGLSFEERYILLLFCWQKYSIHQIARTIMLPSFIIEKRLNAAVSKTRIGLTEGLGAY